MTTESPSALPSLPNVVNAEGKDILPGIRLGGRWSQHRQSFIELERDGFESPPACSEKGVERFLLENTNEVGIAFEYEDGVLQRVEVILVQTPLPGQSVEEAVDSITTALKLHMGQPAISYKNARVWASQDLDTSDPRVAGAFYWPAKARTHAETKNAEELEQFVDGVHRVGQDGVFGMITGLADSLMASLVFFQAPNQNTSVPLAGVLWRR